MTLTPDSALRSVISWEKVSGARTGFNVNWPGASAVGEGSMHDVVTNGLVHPQWASTGLTTPAVSTLGAASWGVKLNMSQVSARYGVARAAWSGEMRCLRGAGRC